MYDFWIWSWIVNRWYWSMHENQVSSKSCFVLTHVHKAVWCKITNFLRSISLKKKKLGHRDSYKRLWRRENTKTLTFVLTANNRTLTTLTNLRRSSHHCICSSAEHTPDCMRLTRGRSYANRSESVTNHVRGLGSNVTSHCIENANDSILRFDNIKKKKNNEWVEPCDGLTTCPGCTPFCAPCFLA